MRNIVLIIDSLIGGGAEVSTIRLADAFLKRGYKVHLIIIKDIVDFDINSEINLISLKFKKRYINIINNIYYANKLKFTLKKIEKEFGKINLILGSLGLSHKLMNKINSDDFYYVLHGTTSKAKLGKRTGIQRLIKLYNIKKLYNKKNLITVSEGIKDDILSIGVVPLSIRKIYNIFDFNLVRELSEEKTNMILPDNYIVHVGRFAKVKRHDVLLKAFSLIKDESLKLLLVGDGEEKVKIEQLVEKLGLSERVVFVGFQQNPYPFIKNAKLLVLSSDHEGLPTVLIESLILNTLPISTNCPGSIEILSPELEDCICKIGDYNDLASVININLINNTGISENLLKKFNEDKIIEEYISLLSS